MIAPMRLVAWNCNMALHRKWRAVMTLRPDLAVIGECARPDRLAAKGRLPRLSGPPLWVGDNRDKGLGVFAFKEWRLAAAPAHDPALRYILPLEVSGPRRFNLLAVWAQNASAGLLRKDEPGPLMAALTAYRDFLAEGPALVAGDFNNNVRWDKPGWAMNQADCVARLEALGLISAYHWSRGEAQGAERRPTHYWRDRRKDGPSYHIDYIFIPRAWTGALRRLRVGRFAPWCGAGLSDHVPLTVDLAL